MNLVPPLSLLAAYMCLGFSPLHGQVEFWSRSGTSDVDDATDGFTVPDHLRSNNYQGYVGEMVLMPTNPNLLNGLPPSAPGLITADSGDTYSGVRGIAGFCIDSETSFKISSSQADRKTYLALTYAQANSRYIADGVLHYLPGNLLRAAYMIDKFYQQAHAGGNIEAAALQAAIWEVLYDSTPNTNTGNGNYYVRNNTGDATLDGRANQVTSFTNTWFAAAVTDNWGGASYDPTNRVIFWLDPNNATLNQSIITLNPWEGLVPVPESEPVLLLAFATGALAFRRRRVA